MLGLRDENLRKRILKDNKLTLQTLIRTCQAEEMAESQNHRTYEDENVHQITKSTKNNYKKKHDTQKKLSKCKFCGKDHVWKKELCPAYNKTCSKCGKLNHFKSQCRNTQTEVTNCIYTIKENNVASINDIAKEDRVTLDTNLEL